MKKLVVLSAVASVVFMSGCASILNEKTQAVNVTATNGQNFKGTVDGVPFNGPAVVPLTRTKASKVFKVETAGCSPETVAESQVDTKFFINILSGGVFGSTTDYSTEKMWKYNDSIAISCASK